MKLQCIVLIALTSLPLQSQTQRATHVYDDSALKPPVGADVAIVEFADYECPACAKDNPILMAAAAQYHIPWVRRDFPLPMHPWSFQAAVYARWFDTQSLDWGSQYRNALYSNQRSIETSNDLRTVTEQFAKDRHLSLPFAVDPLGRLADAVRADAEIGRRTGIHETPTIFIVSNSAAGTSYAQVLERSQLYAMIDRALASAPKKPGKPKRPLLASSAAR